MQAIYHPRAPNYDDYASARSNGMWYQSWQSGYSDILKRGFPAPKDPRTILAELHSPNVPDFLHGVTADVPFLVSERGRRVLEENRLTGFEFAPVTIAKIATKGQRAGRTRGGEPEEAILKSKGVRIENPPALAAVYVTGTLDAEPEYVSGRSPSGNVSPFVLTNSRDVGDLFRPSYRGSSFSAWVFCSERFRSICEEARLTDIAFTPFAEFMGRYRVGA
jgi:hypothetical protein